MVAYKFEPRLEGTVRADYIYNRKNGGGLLGYAGADKRNGMGPPVVGLDVKSGGYKKGKQLIGTSVLVSF